MAPAARRGRGPVEVAIALCTGYAAGAREAGARAEGRIKWLEPDEEERLLDACAQSDNEHLLPIVTIALETGMRYGEIMTIHWDRVDLSCGVIRLEAARATAAVRSRREAARSRCGRRSTTS